MSVREVTEALNRRRKKPLAYTTVMTVMGRLNEKGALSRERAGRGYLYRATAPDPAGIAVNQVLRNHGEAALTHFLDEVREDPELLARLRRLVDGG